ncbi:hypothetical protein [Armatimonas rosea]|uniref:Cytochrome c domain-containing protein n=1 Tax=Armatimonas rosea TaxID=685828 RepID=A0A7W9SST1_ARMRO|nr:hypothetical protein [Armatimonas rosea]MBB6052207.1 hypothetical protein [Armatimonas rosea]
MARKQVFLGAALAGGLALAASVPARPQNSPAERGPGGLEQTFTKELWPVLTGQCAPCHGKKNPSQLLLPADSHTAFLKLVAEGQFDPDNHSSIVYRVTTTDKNIIMPPQGMHKLTVAQITAFDHFAEGVRAQQALSGKKPDEQFPPYLTLPFTGAKKPTFDNTFLTFRQLRGKTKAIFADDGEREDRNLFLDNAALFGGADFVKRFDESAKASPTFLSGVELVARELASKAYLNRTGPFVGFTEQTSEREGITRLWKKLLFRDPTAPELAEAQAFLKSVRDSEASLRQTAPSDLRFSLTVSDERGQHVTREVGVAVRGDDHALTTLYVDQEAEEQPEKYLGSFTLAPGDMGQKVIISNAESYGNVSVVGVRIKGAELDKTLKVGEPGVLIEGAWKLSGASAEDNSENKGASQITFPLEVLKPGKYEVTFLWKRAAAPKAGKRPAGKNLAPSTLCRDLCVQVVSRDSVSAIATPPAPPVPPKGEAHFWIDQSIDNRAHADLKSSFVFGTEGGIEIRNDGTAKRVVADAVRLFVPGSETPILLRAGKAKNKEQWGKFPAESFNPYNTVGPDLLQDLASDGSKKPLSLFFTPPSGEGYDPQRAYRPAIVYPGKADNETRVPIVVKAQASSPIVQVSTPLVAQAGAAITLDASSSYNIQGSKLTFRWTQIGGPRVALADPTQPKLTMKTTRLSAQQAAWEGLCRALMAHPDFLFTRPRSLATMTDPKTRKRLQLVKLAQDLVGRTPSETELAQCEAGIPLEKLVDGYLASKEFTDFYFHRTRLYIESHGTPEQDEPARLWTYLALQNRPFQELLTADYTVDTAFQKQKRPAYFGKTGVLTMRGFIQGKPSLPHFNYSAQVCEKFLGYVFEVPDEIVTARQGITASATTDPKSVCYTCHKVLTPLAYQRAHWDDEGNYRAHDEYGLPIDSSDRDEVAAYPFKGEGIEAFATQAAQKERFLRTILQTHFVWYFGRELRAETDERGLYQRLWGAMAKSNYALKPLVKALVLTPEYLNGTVSAPLAPDPKKKRLAQLSALHQRMGVK